MSTPIPPNIKLEGLDLYAPRGTRTPSAPGSQASPSETLLDVPECDPLRAESREPPAAANEPLKTGDRSVDDAIKMMLLFRDRVPPISASLPPATKLSFEKDPINEAPSAFEPPWLRTTPRRRLPLDPEILPPPPTGVRRDIVTPLLIVLIAGCAAVIGLTMISPFQPDAQPPKRTSENIPAAAPVSNNAGNGPRLVVDV
jgi:hypothetical protein